MDKQTGSAIQHQVRMRRGGMNLWLDVSKKLFDEDVNGTKRIVYMQSPSSARATGALDSESTCEKSAFDVEDEFAKVLPGTLYMDLPDGGSPTILEQVKRMAQDAARFRWLNTYHKDDETRWCAHMLAKRLFVGDYDDIARDIDTEMNKDSQPIDGGVSA